MSKGGPLECGVPEFGGWTLSEGVWVGFRPSVLEGVSEGVYKCRGRALGGGVGAGLGLCVAAGRLRGQRIRPGIPTSSLVPKWTGKVLALFPSVPLRPCPTISPRVSPVTAGPQPWVGPTGCRNSSPSPVTPQGCLSQRSGLYFCSPSPPSHSLRTRVAGGGLGGQRIRPGISAGSLGPKWAGETWPHSLLILCPPNGPPISPFRCGIPSPPPATPQGRQSCPASTSPLPSLNPLPTSYLVAGGSSCPLRCPWSPTSAW